jgi:protein SCO1/2
VIGTAPEFLLTNQDGARVSLSDLSGTVRAVTFIYATCKDTCPLLTAEDGGNPAKARDRLRQAGAIRLDHRRAGNRHPVVLKAYAEKFGADPAGWSFLTGKSEDIQDVVRKYGAFAKRVKPGDVDHLFLTSLVDRKGVLRVQYLGYRFDADEMLRDLRALLRE